MTYIWDKEAVSKGLKIINACRPVLISVLGNLLNEYHGINRSKKYYDMIAGMWLEQFIHISYAAWEQVTAFPAAAEENPVLELSATPSEFSDLVVNSCDYHNKLRLAIRRFLADEWPVACLQKTEDTVAYGISLGNCSMISSQRVKGLIRKFLFNKNSSKDTKVLICDPYFKCHPKDWMLALWKWRHWIRHDDLNEYIAVPVRYDHAWRYSQAKEQVTTDDFWGTLKCLLPLCIPAVYLEGYKDFRMQVLALNKSKPDIVYTANGLQFNSTLKFLSAEWQEQGTVVLCHQHGGGYGLDRDHAVEDYETRVSDRFYSWGWGRSNCNVSPLSAGLHYKKHKKNSKQILLTCTTYPRNVYRLHFQPMPGTIETMIRDTVDFVSIFSDCGCLLIRPSATDYGWGFLEKLKQVAPNVKYDTFKKRPSPFNRYSESLLVVHNYLGTSWLETLALNIPTVCFFDPNTYKFREVSVPHVQALEHVGILHRSGKKAAHFVRDKWPEIEAWWQEAEVQRARSAFCANYANFSPDWPQQWETEFRRVLSQKACN